MLVLVVRDHDSTGSVALGVLELDRSVMDFVPAQNIVDALQDRVARRRRHVLDEHVAAQSMRARTQAPDVQIVNIDHAVDATNRLRDDV